MSRLTKIVLVFALVFAFVAITAVAAIFALDSWYKDFGPNHDRLQGRWTCSSTVRWEGVSMINEPCMVHNADGSNSFYYLDWNESSELVVVTNSIVNEIG